jgi:hypothetical protein
VPLKEIRAKSEDRRKPILIIGNSPPDYCPTARPFKKFISHRGHRYSWRGECATWEELVRDLHERPLVYLFLEHQGATKEASEALNVFVDLHNAVKDLLKNYFPVVHCLATREGVAKGLKEAADLINELATSRSNLRISILNK